MLFTVGSTLCSLAPATSWLVVFRMLHAAGGSMLTPVAMATLTHTFPQPRQRARAIGAWGGVGGLSMAGGPVLGGLLVQSGGWRSLFWVNVPIGLAALVLTTLYVPESRAARPRRPDPVGQVLATVLLRALTYAVIEAPALGWTSPLIVVCLMAAAGGAGLARTVREPARRTAGRPTALPQRAFSGATATALCAFTTLGGFLFANALYLQQELGLSAGRRAAPASHGVPAPFRANRRQPRATRPTAVVMPQSTDTG
ncbi:MFS transporter [Streptomyces sp. NBC_01408]|uniref:MFS transporter n=1 Tax=Streptomyces sp. NBC_01408 TaxID=2903855 RepID=UPI0022511AFF|nr:MFS transporter [Streptomyces sp. NBC_01408]MCX4695510.1 MFS transporter [Streptomyces sp. NBC_01408]